MNTIPDSILGLVRAAAAQLPAGAVVQGVKELVRDLERDPQLSKGNYEIVTFDLCNACEGFVGISIYRDYRAQWRVEVGYEGGSTNATSILLRAQVLVVAAHLAKALEAALAEH